MASPFLGAWRDVSNTHDGFYLLTETHFGYLWAEKGRPAISGQPSDEDAAALFQTIVAAAGTSQITPQGEGWLHEKKTLISCMPNEVGLESKELWTFDGERGEMKDLNSDGRLSLLLSLEKVSESGTSPFAGAWELVSDAYEGLMLRTDSYYSAVVTRRNRPLPQASVPTAEGDPTKLAVADAAALYRAAQTAVVGTYTIDGMKTTTRTLVDRNPVLVGRESTRVWRFEGDRAIGVPEGGGEAVIWRKVS